MITIFLLKMGVWIIGGLIINMMVRKTITRDVAKMLNAFYQK